MQEKLRKLDILKPLAKKLQDFPEAIVARTSTDFNKAFHSKIFTLVAASESEMHGFARTHSPHYRYCFCFMRQGEGQWFLDWEGVGAVRAWILREIKRNGSRPIFDVHTHWQGERARYDSLCRAIDSLKLRGLSDELLYDEFERFHVAYVVGHGGVAYMADTFMSTGEKDWLEEIIGEELRQRAIPETELPETVRLLTNSLHQSYTLEAEWRIIELGVLVEKEYGAKFPPLAALQKKSPHLHQLLLNHARSFYWIHNNYFNVEVLDAVYFYQELQKKHAELQKLGSSFGVILAAHKNELAQLQSQRDILVEKLALSPFILELLKVAWLFAKWKDIRKKGSYIGMHYFELFLSELARRTGYKKDDLSYLVFQEVRPLLFERMDFSRVIAERREQAFFAVTPEGYYIVGGKEADRYFKYTRRDAESVSKLKGVSACRGTARGKVRVIRKTEDMRVFEQGEILVANQTTPEFVPIMKKASAIITEQGGITSHAAVISRELNVPCVIGIKTATRVLQTGDKVEVDANSGVVKVIKRVKSNIEVWWRPAP